MSKISEKQSADDKLTNQIVELNQRVSALRSLSQVAEDRRPEIAEQRLAARRDHDRSVDLGDRGGQDAALDRIRAAVEEDRELIDKIVDSREAVVGFRAEQSALRKRTRALLAEQAVEFDRVKGAWQAARDNDQRAESSSLLINDLSQSLDSAKFRPMIEGESGRVL